MAWILCFESLKSYWGSWPYKDRRHIGQLWLKAKETKTVTYRALKANFFKGGKKRVITSRMGLVLYLIGGEAMWDFWTNHRAKWRKANTIPVSFDTRLEMLITNKNSKSGKRAKTWMTKPKLLLVLHLICWEVGASFLQNQNNPGLVSTLTKKLPFYTVPHCVT